MLPDIVITEHEGIRVVRDDLISGGTKQRVLECWLPELGPGEYVYASPAEGYAQIALALACKALGPQYRAHIFVARRKQMHYRTLEAQRQGATITACENIPAFNVLAARARQYVEGSQAKLLPFGLDSERFREWMTALIKGDWRRNERETPKEVWVTVGSGTLLRCLQNGVAACKVSCCTSRA